LDYRFWRLCIDLPSSLSPAPLIIYHGLPARHSLVQRPDFVCLFHISIPGRRDGVWHGCHDVGIDSGLGCRVVWFAAQVRVVFCMPLCIICEWQRHCFAVVKCHPVMRVAPIRALRLLVVMMAVSNALATGVKGVMVHQVR
jgi:hypothetical protein